MERIANVQVLCAALADQAAHELPAGGVFIARPVQPAAEKL